MAKVKIQGNASGTGVLTVTAPNTSTDRTVTLPDATGTLINTAPSTSGNILTSDGTDWTSAAAAAGGKVLQVVTPVSHATTTSTSSTSWTSTSHSISITPSKTSSKVLLTLSNGSGFTQWEGEGFYVTIYKGSTNLGESSYGFQRIYAEGAAIAVGYSLVLLDSPATTSSTTYTIYFKSGGGNSVSYHDSDMGKPYLTAMEIGA